MGIFQRKTTDKVKKTKAPKAEKVERVGNVAPRTDRSSFVLVSPHVSEKAAKASALGSYVFDVPLSAGKIEIRKAVESMYNVHVVRVNTVRGIGKVVRRGRIEGRRNNWKKAIVTLKSGETLDLYSGV